MPRADGPRSWSRYFRRTGAPPDYHAGNTLQPDIRHRGHDPSWGGRTHHTTADVRPHPKRGKSSGQPRLCKWVSWQKQDSGGRLQNSSVQAVQHKGPAEEFPEGRPRLENVQRCEKKWREILIQLGGAFSSSRSRKRRSLSSRMDFGKNCTENVECHVPQVLLQLKIIKLRIFSSLNQGGFSEAFSSKYWCNSPATTRLGLDEALTGIPCRDRPFRFGLGEALTGIPCQHLSRLGLDEALIGIPCRDWPPGLVWMKP